MKFGVICEGPTDFAVISNILMGYCNDKNLEVDPLQPRENEDGGWEKVFKYLEDEEFQAAVSNRDFTIVHMDSDVFETAEVGENYRLNLNGLSAEEKLDKVKALIISKIDAEFFSIASQRIIFAIAIEAVECWLLPIYFPTQKAKAAKFVNCLSTLNPELSARHGFTIHAKVPNQYKQISKPYLKKSDLEKLSQMNPSLKCFYLALEEKVEVKPLS